MKLISFIGALTQLIWKRHESPLIQFGVSETVIQLTGKSRLRQIQEDLRKGETFDVRLPFGILIQLGHKIAGEYLYRTAIDRSADIEVRKSALCLIGSLQDSERSGRLIALAQQPDERIRDLALLHLKGDGKNLYYFANILQAMLLVEREPHPMAALIDMLFIADRSLLPPLSGDREFWDAVVTHSDTRLRFTGIKVLGEFGEEATSYVPLLSDQLMAEEGVEVKKALVCSLGQTITDQSDASLAIADCLREKDHELVCAAFDALAQLGPLAAPAVPRLTLEMMAKDEWRRRRALAVLKVVGVEYPEPPQANDDSAPLQVILPLDRKIWALHEMPIFKLVAAWTGLGARIKPKAA